MAKRQLSLPDGYSLMMLGDSTSSSPSYSEKVLISKGSSSFLAASMSVMFCSLPALCTISRTAKTRMTVSVIAWYQR